MRLRLALLIVTLPCVTACTTVDFSSMANAPSSSSSRDSLKKNIVERSVGKLFAVFSKNGWSERDAQNKMEAATSILLKGMSASQGQNQVADASYVETVPSLAVLNKDLKSATYHIDQTTKAAEVFHAMAPQDSNLRRELQSLEKALSVSREAEENFKRAGIRFGADQTQPEWRTFERSVERLLRVTDSFGDSVRAPVQTLEDTEAF